MSESDYFEALTYLKIKGIMLKNNVDIFPNKEHQKIVLDELHREGYININATSMWLATKGYVYLEPHRLERLPTNIPTTYDPQEIKNTAHPGTKFVSALKMVGKFINENIWLATIIGGLILYLIIVYISNHFGIKAK